METNRIIILMMIGVARNKISNILKEKSNMILLKKNQTSHAIYIYIYIFISISHLIKMQVHSELTANVITPDPTC